MKLLPVAMIALGLGLLPAPASAAVIGLLGGDYDPPPVNITDPTASGLVACSTQPGFDLPSTYYCLFYNAFSSVAEDDFNAFPSIFSFDFRLFDGLLLPITSNLFIDIPFSDLDGSDGEGGAVQSAFSEDGFRLFGGTISPTSPCEFECPPVVDAVAFFVGPDSFHTGPNISAFSVSSIAVNDVATVPEPAMLFLLVPAYAALLARRKVERRRKTCLTR